MTDIIKVNSHIDPVDYVLDVLSNSDKKAFEQHIAKCDECLEAVQKERLIEQMVRDSVQSTSIPSDSKLMAFMPKPPEASYYRSPFRRPKVGRSAKAVGFGGANVSSNLALSWFSPALSMTMILFLFCGFLFLRAPASVAIGATSTSTSTATMTATISYTATAIAYEQGASAHSPEFTPVPNATPIAQLVPIRANQLITNVD